MEKACKRMCPKGTIPISKTYIINHPKPSPVTKAFNPTAHDSAQVYEQADIYRGDSYHGAHGVLNVWNPKVTGNGEFSSAKIRLSAGTGPNLNSIEVGWHVFPVDQHPRFYVYWTKDNYGKTGCYNLECPGFVQTNNNFFVDDPLYPVSTYGGVQYQTAITIHKDRASGNWWVRKEGEDVGYWPADIFTELGQRAMYISWGGEVFNSGILSNGKHTSTQMGSGHFPGEGNLKAAYLANLGVIDEYADVPREPKNLARFVTKTSCYDVLMGKKGEHGFGTHIYFGGPGYSAQCP